MYEIMLTKEVERLTTEPSDLHFSIFLDESAAAAHKMREEIIKPTSLPKLDEEK